MILLLRPVDQAAILKCYNSTESHELELAMAKRTNEIWPEKHRFVPWIMINNVSLLSRQIYQENFFQFLCKWYNGRQPDGCTMAKSSNLCFKQFSASSNRVN